MSQAGLENSSGWKILEPALNPSEPQTPNPKPETIKRFRGGLVLKTHGRWYHSTLGSRVVKKKPEIRFAIRDPPELQSLRGPGFEFQSAECTLDPESQTRNQVRVPRRLAHRPGVLRRRGTATPRTFQLYSETSIFLLNTRFTKF